jgi:hypothetical protein
MLLVLTSIAVGARRNTAYQGAKRRRLALRLRARDYRRVSAGVVSPWGPQPPYPLLEPPLLHVLRFRHAPANAQPPGPTRSDRPSIAPGR